MSRGAEAFRETARLVRADGRDPAHPMSEEMAEGEARFLESQAERWEERERNAGLADEDDDEAG